MSLHFNQARFVKGAYKFEQCLPDDVREVAVAGRSNAGKSSALNVITGIHGLARTSRQPGRTQQINYFELAQDKYLVDLPGYGFARVPPKVRQHWDETLSRYFETRQSLQGLVVIMDVRHPLKDLDQQLIDWVGQMDIPVHCVLTKADKLKHGPASANLQKVRKQLEAQGYGMTAQLFSAADRQGVEEVREVIRQWLE